MGHWAGMLVPGWVQGSWELRPQPLAGQQVREEGCAPRGGGSSCKGSEGGANVRSRDNNLLAGPRWVPGSSEHPRECLWLIGSGLGVERLGFAAEVVTEALEPGSESQGEGMVGGSRNQFSARKAPAKCCPEVVKDSPVHLAHHPRAIGDFGKTSCHGGGGVGRTRWHRGVGGWHLRRGTRSVDTFSRLQGAS